MKFTKIIAAAMLPCALMAAPAFAQSSATDAEDYAQDKVENAKDDIKIMSDTATESLDGTVTAKGDPLTIETPSNVITATEGEVVVSEEGMMLKGKDIMTEPKTMNEPMMIDKPAMMDAPAAVTTVTIACPEGTTAQDDGTCMITGDYEE